MLNRRIIPCLLLENEKLVKTIKFKTPKYIGDPINAVKIYNDKEVDEIIFLDITATIKNTKPPFKLISEIANECFMPFAYGGGINNVEDMKKIFSLGVEKIIINSNAIKNPNIIKEAMELFGSQSIIVSIDAKKNWAGKYEVFSECGKKSTGLDPVEWSKKVEKLGAGEIFLTSIEKDGTMEGYDLDLIQKVANKVNIPVIACGGAGEIKDFSKAIKFGASAVAAGSLFVYQGKNMGVLINFPTKEQIKSIGGMGQSIIMKIPQKEEIKKIVDDDFI